MVVANGEITCISLKLASLYTIFACALILILLDSALAQDESAYWLKKGHAFSLNGSYQEALDSFDRALKLNSEDAAAWKGKGEALGQAWQI